MALLKETASAGFDETVELHIRLGVNVRHAEEQLRGTLALPHGLGKDVTIAVFAQGEKARDAEAAGADFVGADDLAKRVEEGWTDFDVAIATPDMMPTVGKLGRILGPQGKMPNPKVGTVTDDVEKAVSESKSGKVEYRTDRQAVIHLAIGKASFEGSHLLDNYNAVIEEINRAKPAAAKGRYIITVTLATTMGPGIRVDSTKVGERDAAAHPRRRRRPLRAAGRGAADGRAAPARGAVRPGTAAQRRWSSGSAWSRLGVADLDRARAFYGALGWSAERRSGRRRRLLPGRRDGAGAVEPRLAGRRQRVEDSPGGAGSRSPTTSARRPRSTP